jgi:hypothetical protein
MVEASRHRWRSRRARSPASDRKGGIGVIVAASRLVAKLLLRGIAVGSLVVVELGVRRRFGAGAPTATVEIRSQRVWRLLVDDPLDQARAVRVCPAADANWACGRDQVGEDRVADRHDLGRVGWRYSPGPGWGSALIGR